MQPILVQRKKEDEEIVEEKYFTPLSTRKSKRHTKVKTEPIDSPRRKRVNQQASGPGKRRKPLNIIQLESNESKGEK